MLSHWMSRRTAIGTLAAVGIAPALAKRAPTYPWPLGLQLWSVGEDLAKDLPGTFAKLGALGYVRAETAGWHGRKPADFAKAAIAAGITCDSAHVGMGQLMKDIPAAIGEARDAGCKWLVCAAPQPSAPLKPGLDWISAIGEAMTLDDWRRHGDIAARTGEAAKRAGIGFAWHNHVAEFVAKDGNRGIDVLLGATDPDHMALELDIAWARIAGEDPAQFINAHAARVRLIHVKDVARGPDGKLWLAVPGEGMIDWRTTFAAARRAGVRHAFVEIEAPHRRPIMQELAATRDFLATI